MNSDTMKPLTHPSIVFLDAETIGSTKNISLVESFGRYTSYNSTKPEETIEHIGDNQVVITNKVRIDRQIMDVCPCLKLICIAATGMNNIDLEYARQKGIEVMNVSGYSTDSVAQHTFSMLFHLLNKTYYYDTYVKSGNYSKSSSFTCHERPFWEIKGKRFGIIGLGTIGKKVAVIASAFGANVVYHSTSGVNLNNPYPHLSLPDLLTSSDIVSIHCPLNSNTSNLINLERLRLMKPTAILLNTGRGKIINEQDLAYALTNNIISAAGIDVFETEPINPENPLLALANKEKIVLTPHIAWTSMEAREELVKGIYEIIKRFYFKE